MPALPPRVLQQPAALIAAALLGLLGPDAAMAHSGAPAAAGKPAPKAPEFKLEKVSERVYCLFGRGGNVGFLVTDAGVLVVDDQ